MKQHRQRWKQQLVHQFVGQAEVEAAKQNETKKERGGGERGSSLTRIIARGD